MLTKAAAICIAAAQPTANYAGEPPALAMPGPKIPARASTAAGFAPRGWKVEKAVKGDLNRDGQTDLAIILIGEDANCIVYRDGIAEPMDTNPRLVLIAFGDKNGFRLQLSNPRVIPRMDDPYMDDPLNLDAFMIRRNVLRLGLTYWRSMGGWTTFSSTLSFRWDGTRMRLIGYDRDTTQRNSGATETLSVNFLTGEARKVTGSIEDDRSRPARMQRIPPQKLQALEAMGDGLAYEPIQKGRH